MTLEKPQPTPLTISLEENKTIIKNLVGKNADLIIRDIQGVDGGRFAIAYFDGMTDKDAIGQFILKPLLLAKTQLGKLTPQELGEQILFIPNLNTATTAQAFMNTIYSGDCGILLDGFAMGLVTDIKGFERRSISEPATEIVVRGSREGFVENMKSNMAMLRRRLKSPNLAFENLQLGTETATNICVAYIRGLAPEELVDEVKRRLNAIKIDGVLESGYLEQLIEDNPFSPFATIGNSEKPDKVTAKLLEGRVAVIVDGTPFVLTAPMVFLENFQSAEDYYSRPYFATMVRFLRFFAFAISVFLPGFYIAVVSYQQEVIPYSLMLNMWQAEANTPFSAGLSIFLITLVYEIVREAGVRLPRPVGAAISIVGGLVIGDMAVGAGLVSAPVVIVVAFTAIAMFVIDAMTDAATILRFMLIFLSWGLGFWGLLIGSLLLLAHLASIKSFGVPYFMPFAPFVAAEMRDSLVRAPLWLLGRRPKALAAGSKWRQREVLPPEGEDKPLVEAR